MTLAVIIGGLIALVGGLYYALYLADPCRGQDDEDDWGLM